LLPSRPGVQDKRTRGYQDAVLYALRVFDDVLSRFFVFNDENQHLDFHGNTPWPGRRELGGYGTDSLNHGLRCLLRISTDQGQ
jgi:hypothetical protein